MNDRYVHHYEPRYLLCIDTWPALRGAPCEGQQSYHDTPADALAYLETQTEPYYHAYLQCPTSAGHMACDWEGHIVAKGQKWPMRRGTNGEHPAYLAFMADHKNLIAMIRAEHARTGEGMIYIAHRLLTERHPQIMGWAEKLAWTAAGNHIVRI